MNDTRIDDAVDLMRLVGDAESENRANAADDLRFAAGDQWDAVTSQSRELEKRPMLTINKVDAYCRQIENQQRQQRPRIKVDPINNEADAKVAEVITGIIRHIEVNSNADTAYDTAFSYSVRMGWGYWRVVTDYVREDSFDQEIYIRPIENPFSVYFDPNSVLPDGSDAEKCLITTLIPKETFRKQYPGMDDGANFATGDKGVDAEWITKEDIRVAEYFYTERRKATLVLLSDGHSVFEDELPSMEMMQLAGITIVNKRTSMRKVIKWCKLTAIEVLEEKEWPGRFIPVVPTYGQQLLVDGRRKRFGLVRPATDPQKMYNYWQTALTESIALAPKAKWLMAEGQNEGHENDWADANQKTNPVLVYKQTDLDNNPAPPPQRLQPEPPPAGVMGAAAAISQDLQAVIGIVDPNQLPSGNISGKALQGQQSQVDMSNFHYFDNLTRSMAQTGRIILDLVPKILDTARVMRIIGEDGQPDLVEINTPVPDPENPAVQKVLNDLTVGEYSVTMDTGPGYNSKRQAAVDGMMGLLQADPSLMQTAGDLIFRNLDFPGADIIADRLAAANPMAQIDEKSPVPPQAQMMIVQGKKMLEDAQKEIQALQMQLKYRGDIADKNNAASIQKALMDNTAKAHIAERSELAEHKEMELKIHAQAHETVIKTQTQLRIEKMKAAVALALSQFDDESQDDAKEEVIERAV